MVLSAILELSIASERKRAAKALLFFFGLLSADNLPQSRGSTIRYGAEDAAAYQRNKMRGKMRRMVQTRRDIAARLLFAYAGADGRLSGKVGQMNAKPKLVEIEKKQRQTKKKAAPKRTRKRGAQKMREAADKVIGRDSKQIAEALSKNGKKGQLQSIKFMYDLSERGAQSAEESGAQKMRSLAAELANAPEWMGEPATANRNDHGDTEE